jgi:hypothetical protein
MAGSSVPAPQRVADPIGTIASKPYCRLPRSVDGMSNRRGTALDVVKALSQCLARNPEAAANQSAPVSIQALLLSDLGFCFFTNLDIAGNERKR